MNGMKETVLMVNPEQAQRALLLCWRCNIPVALIGGVGVGKTTLVRDLIARLQTMQEKKEHTKEKKSKKQYKMWYHRLPTTPLEDLQGIPSRKEGKNGGPATLEYLMLPDMPFDNDDTGIIFGDEFDRVTEVAVQNAFMSYLESDCIIHGHKLSPNAFVVLAMNGTSDMYTTELSRATRTRICSLYVSRHTEGASESYQEWAKANGISAVGQTFSKYRPELFTRDEDFEEQSECVPRSADVADRVLQKAKEMKLKTDDILTPVIAGLIGKKAAIEFMAIARLINEAPSVEDILDDPLHVRIPDNMSIFTALCRGLCDEVQGDQYKAAKACRYIVRWPAEHAAAAFKELHKHIPAIVTFPSFMKWTKDHPGLLT